MSVTMTVTGRRLLFGECDNDSDRARHYSLVSVTMTVTGGERLFFGECDNDCDRARDYSLVSVTMTVTG